MERIKTQDREKYEDRLRKRVRQFMKKHGIQNKELAVVLDDSEGNVSNRLTGGRPFSPYHIKKICEEYHVSADHFIRDDFPEETHAAHDICQQTGLSEQAVKILCALNADPDHDHAAERQLIIDTLNKLLENTITPAMIEDNALFLSPVYQIGEYIGLTEPPTINGSDKVFVQMSVGDAAYQNMESVRELYAERTLRLITRGLDKLKEILASKKRNQ